MVMQMLLVILQLHEELQCVMLTTVDHLTHLIIGLCNLKHTMLLLMECNITGSICITE